MAIVDRLSATRILVSLLAVACTPATQPRARLDKAPCPAGMVLIAGHTVGGTQRAVHTLADGGTEYRDFRYGDEPVPAVCLAVRPASHDEYARCVSAGACSPLACAETGRTAVSCAEFDQANAYCRHIGARLQRHHEWQLAVFGPDHRRFPWGNQPLPTGQREYTTPEGVADIGTADEWVDREGDARATAYRFFSMSVSADAAPYTSELGSNAPEGAAIRCAVSPPTALAARPTTR